MIRMLSAQGSALARKNTDDIAARREQLRLGKSVGGCASARIWGNHVVSEVRGTLIAGRADADYERIVGRRVQPAIVIAGGNDDDDAVEPQDFGRRGDRIRVIGLVDAAVKR